MFLCKNAHIVPHWSDKNHVVEIVRDMQHHISRYLFTITLTNLCLGTVDGIMLRLIGMPNPLLWVVMIALLNFIPYLGAITSITILTLIAFIIFHPIGPIRWCQE